MKDSLEILKQEERDLEIIKKVMSIKGNLSAFLSTSEIIQQIITFIDESEIFDFKTQRNKKYISETRPLFIVKSKSDKHIKEIYPDLSNIEDRQSLVTEAVHREIVTRTSDYLSKTLKDKDLFAEVLKKNDIELNDDLFEISSLMSFLTTAIFSINCDFTNGTIYIEYMI